MTKLGLNNGQLTKCPGTPNCVNSQVDDKYHIQPLIFNGNIEEAQAKLLTILEGFKNAKIVVNEDNYIRAEFTSKLFRFVDDVEFYFPVTEEKEITIHLRSASRVGHSDLGANRKRMEQFRALLK